MARKNQQKLQYALQIAEIPEFETTYYEDSDGNKYPTGVKPTGKTEIAYSDPVPFMASIAGSGGEAEAVQYGMSVSDYSAKLVFPKGEVPLENGALIWHTSEPQYKYGGEEMEIEVNDEIIKGKFPERTSADYYVVKVPPCINNQDVLLKAINKAVQYERT